MACDCRYLGTTFVSHRLSTAFVCCRLGVIYTYVRSIRTSKIYCRTIIIGILIIIVISNM